MKFATQGLRRSTVSELLASVEYQNLLIAKLERLSDILDIGHPGIEARLSLVIEMLEIELDL